MNFSIVSTKELIPDDLRTTFAGLVREEISAREPAQGVKLLYSAEPEQLKFNFSYSKKTSL